MARLSKSSSPRSNSLARAKEHLVTMLMRDELTYYVEAKRIETNFILSHGLQSLNLNGTWRF